MSLRLLVSHKPPEIKRIILGFPLESFPWCSWSQQQIDFWMWGRWSSLYYCLVKLPGRGILNHLHNHFFLLFWPHLVLFWPSSSAPASPPAVFCLPPLLTTFLVFSPTTLSRADELWLILTKRWSFLSTELSRRSSSCLVEFLLRLRSSHFFVLPDLFLNLLFHVNKSFPETLYFRSQSSLWSSWSPCSSTVSSSVCKHFNFIEKWLYIFSSNLSNILDWLFYYSFGVLNKVLAADCGSSDP